MNYSPGPWLKSATLTIHNESTYVCVKDARGCEIVAVPHIHPDDRDLDNLSLIAMAPEMLSLLETIYAEQYGQVVMESNLYDTVHSMLERLK